MKTIIVVLATVYAYFYKNKILRSDQDREAGLTNDEKKHVIVSEVFSPILAGAVYYYGLRGTYPNKANEANKYSWKIAGVLIFIVMLVSMLIGIIASILTGSSY